MITTLKEIKFQYYDGFIGRPIPLGFIDMQTFILKHKNPSKKMIEVFKQINKASKDNNKSLKKKLKQENLYYFTPAAIFEGRRRYSDMVSFTGLAQLDFDNVERAVALKEYLFENYQEIVCCYLSPSGQGVKAIIKIPTSKDINEFREYYSGLINEFEGIDGFDMAPKNAALPLFLSIDEDLLYREGFGEWTKKGKVMKEADYVNLNVIAPDTDFSDDGYGSQGYYEKITIDIFKTKLHNVIDSDGHPRLRNACLVLGSRVGAGYVDYSTALAIAEYEVKMHSYFQKDLLNYLSTVKWGINQGMNSPKYYK